MTFQSIKQKLKFGLENYAYWKMDIFSKNNSRNSIIIQLSDEIEK